MKRSKITKAKTPRGTKTARTTRAKTWPSSAPGQPGFGDPINKKSIAASEGEAATAIARAWLAKAGFHEDPDGESPERIEFKGLGWDGESHEHYVDVRVYASRRHHYGGRVSCRHRNVVVGGSHETGASSARCSDCKVPLSRRIEGGDYVYVSRDDHDNVEVVFGQAGGRACRTAQRPAPLPVATARQRKP